MGNSGETSTLKTIGIILVIVVGVVILFNLFSPVLGLGFDAIWGLAGILAFILRVALFIALTVAGILGLILLVSWLIREFTS